VSSRGRLLEIAKALIARFEKGGLALSESRSCEQLMVIGSGSRVFLLWMTTSLSFAGSTVQPWGRRRLTFRKKNLGRRSGRVENLSSALGGVHVLRTLGVCFNGGGSPSSGPALPEEVARVLRLRKVPVDRPQRLESGLELVCTLSKSAAEPSIGSSTSRRPGVKETHERGTRRPRLIVEVIFVSSRDVEKTSCCHCLTKFP